MKVAVYTAIFGNYDDPKEWVKQSVDCDFLVFNDTYELPEELKILHPRHKAKYFKLQPHKIPTLCKYDVIIWVDGSAEIKSPDFVKDMLFHLEQDEIMAFKHPEGRDCVYQEAEYSKNMPKYQYQPIESQANYYKLSGYPEHNGLYACGMMVYKLTTKIQATLNDWWIQNLTWTYQDQISFPYVLWKNKTQLKVLDLDLYNNAYLHFHTSSHKSLL